VENCALTDAGSSTVLAIDMEVTPEFEGVHVEATRAS